MKHIKQWLLIASAVLLVSCVEEYQSDFLPDKPSSLAMHEFLNSYDVLKECVDRNASPAFMLGTSITASNFTNQQTLYSLVHSNFDEITVKDAMIYGSVASEDGNLNFGNVMGLVETASQSNIAVFGHTLVWHANQSSFLDRSIAPTYIPEIIIPPTAESGTALLFDFESDNLGDTYPMTVPTNGTSTVIEDPAGSGGKVLSIGSPEALANQSEPVFNIKLPEGIQLKHCSNLILDIYVVDNNGMYGQGLRMKINGKEGVVGTNFQALGALNNAWAKNLKVPLSMVPLSAEDKELSEFTLSFGNRTGTGNYLYDNIKIEYATLETGSESVDFELNNVGDTYPMTEPDRGTATIALDPAGSGKKVLRIGSSESPANQSEPIFNFKLPEGITLGDCKKLGLSVYVIKGQWGQGLRFRINDKEASDLPGWAGMGAQNNNWSQIMIDLSEVPLTSEDKNLTEFTVVLGNKTGEGYYYYDNFRIDWETGSEPTIIPEQIIWKTDEEVKDILTDAMESWISGVMEASDGYIKAWSVVNEPMDDENPTELKFDPNPPSDPKDWIADENFYWQDYLGKDYARLAVKFARQYGGNDLKLFVNDYGLEAKGNDKCKGLIEMIDYWESDGVTRIDGIGTQMSVTYSLDPILQAENEATIVDMFELLAQSGKLIRISGLTMGLVDANGVAVPTKEATSDQQSILSQYFNFIIGKYFEIIPDEQRYGISINNPVDTDREYGLWNTQYNRNITYTGFADGLKGE